jgi:hypothetical protein
MPPILQPSLLVQLDRVDGPVGVLESLGIVRDIVVTGAVSSRASALLVPDIRGNIISAKGSVENLSLLVCTSHHKRQVAILQWSAS